MLTLADLHKHVLPLKSHVLAGMAGMAARVGWAVRLDADMQIDLDDVILAHDEIDADTLKAFAASGAAGLVVDYQPPTVVTGEADLLAFPILRVPEKTRLQDVEREIVRAIVQAENDQAASLERNHEGLLQLLVDNKGVEEIIHALARLTGKAAILQDKRLRIMAEKPAPDMLVDWESIQERILHFSALPEVLRDRHRLHKQPPSMLQSLEDFAVDRLIAPVISGGVGRGFVSLIGRRDEFTSSDSAIIEYGAMMCALEMLKAKEVSEAEKRLRGDFLDYIIAGEWREDEIQDQIARLRHNLLSPHIIIVARWRSGADRYPSVRRLETLVHGVIKLHKYNALVRLAGEEVRIFLSCQGENPMRDARRFAELIIEDSKAEYPTALPAIGVGPMAETLRGWRASYLDAAAAADFARLTNASRPLDAREIGVYRFLTAPGNWEALRTLRDDILGDLLQYDEQHGGDLLKTLEGFFNANGHLRQTAESLHIHRNTLQYRLARISELTKLDMSQPDTRLAIQLAVKSKRLLDGELQSYKPLSLSSRN